MLARQTVKKERIVKAWIMLMLALTLPMAAVGEEHLGKVFDPFFTTKPVGEGLGLGLAVSYAIVHELGGRLTVNNLAEGALFTLTLPIAQEN